MATIDRSRSNWDKESKISEFWIAGGGERKLNKREKIRESSEDGARIMGPFSSVFMGFFFHFFFLFFLFSIKLIINIVG